MTDIVVTGGRGVVNLRPVMGREGPEGPVGPVGPGSDITGAEIEAARDVTLAARDEVLAVPTTTDGLIAGQIQTPGSQTETALSAAFVPGTQIPGGQPAGALGDAGINIKTGYAGNKIAGDLSGCFVAGGTGPGYDNVIGNGVIANIGTTTPNAPANDADLLGTNASVSAILGGYDNVAAGLASIIAGFHCYTTTTATHGTISGGSYHGIDSGDYNTIGGGTLNKIKAGVNQSINGGRQNELDGAGNSTIVGGILNKTFGQASTSGGSSIVVGDFTVPLSPVAASFVTAFGALHTVTKSEATALGRQHTITAQGASGLGSTNTLSGTYAFASGFTNNVSGTAGGAIGQDLTVSAPHAFATGRYAVSRVEGGVSQASGRFAVNGDAQTTTVVVRRQTVDGTANQVLGTNGSSTTWQMPDDSSGIISIMVVARDAATGDTAAWRIDATCKNDTGVNAAFLGTPTITPIGTASAGAATWAVSMATGTDSVAVRGTGEAGKTINWVARMTFTEVVA